MATNNFDDYLNNLESEVSSLLAKVQKLSEKPTELEFSSILKSEEIKKEAKNKFQLSKNEFSLGLSIPDLTIKVSTADILVLLRKIYKLPKDSN
jgi:hypothetical protein